MGAVLRIVSSMLALSFFIALSLVADTFPLLEGLLIRDEPSRIVDSQTVDKTSMKETNIRAHGPVDSLDGGAPFELVNELFNSIDERNIFSFQSSTWIDPTIRKWGCDRKESPLIFVHIGKAGGGTTRARFAAAALDYNRTHWAMTRDDNHYYPIVNASFCTSQYHSWKHPSRMGEESFEGNLPCSATTPVGMALGCPEALGPDKLCRGCQDLSSKRCNVVYVGHNSIGSELQWLPPDYLHKWWRKSTFSSLSIDWKVTYPEPYVWCFGNRRHHRPTNERRYRDLYEQCSVPISRQWDTALQHFWKNHSFTESHNGQGSIPLNYAPIYASMPVQRVTLVREPWSWLISKFFWHHGLDTNKTCDDLGYAKVWVNQYSLQFITYLCGDECAIRISSGKMSIEEMWVQAETNLRQSFSVVGLLNESSVFYDMITTRVAYLDLNRNPHVKGDRHTGRNSKTRRCHELFRDDAFRETFRHHLPIVLLLERLFHVAVQVNRFQQKELRSCQRRTARSKEM